MSETEDDLKANLRSLANPLGPRAADALDAKDAKIAVLQAKNDELGQGCAELERRVDSDYAASLIADLHARIAELEAALRPFAGYAEGCDPGLVNYLPDPCPLRATPANGRESGVSPTMGDTRRARAALNPADREGS